MATRRLGNQTGSVCECVLLLLLITATTAPVIHDTGKSIRRIFELGGGTLATIGDGDDPNDPCVPVDGDPC